MRILVASGSKHGGTHDIAAAIAQTLRGRGYDVICAPADEVHDVADYDAVVIGAGLYAGRWVASARRLVSRNVGILRERSVWLFSSGPLDDTAARSEIPPTRSVAKLAARVDARGHATFGGALAEDSSGFIVSRMARGHAGDWRDWDQVGRWATEIADQLEAGPRRVRAVHPVTASLPTSHVLAIVAAMTALLVFASDAAQLAIVTPLEAMLGLVLIGAVMAIAIRRPRTGRVS